jgi:glycosyltransferase involved in cell wall biosynthesis
MRIGVIAPPWAPIPPQLYGGIEQAVDGLARGLAAAGHDVLLFATGDSTCPVPRQWVLPEAEGFRMGFTVPELRHVLAAYEAVAGCDIVHDHTVVGPVLAAYAPPGLPVVTTVHGPFNAELTDIYRRTAARVPIIAISNAQRAAVPDMPVARVIHHGLDPARFPVGAGKGDYCLFLGRMIADKGAQRAIVAARKAGRRLLLAGKCREDWEQQFFQREIAPLLGEDVEYLGEVPHDEKLRLLGDAYATLFPIRWNEPFGLVMIESLACGTPVLAFREGAAPEVIVDGLTGFLCDSEDDMADALTRIDAIDRAACRAAVEGYFSMDRVVREHVELFEATIRSTPRWPPGEAPEAA